ncbi:MAG: HEAT repeat domain-containing protein [Planctomycetota bacterium]
MMRIVLTAAAMLIGLVNCAATASAATTADDPKFAASKQRFLAAVASGNENDLLDALNELRGFDNKTTAELILKHTVAHPDLVIHQQALEALSLLRDRQAQEFVINEAMTAKAWETRCYCLRVMGYFGGEFVAAKLGDALKDKKWQVRSATIRALANYRTLATIEVLVQQLKIEKGRVVADLLAVLRDLTGMPFEARYDDWQSWWTTAQVDFKVPTLEDARAKLGKEKSRRDLKTAVREGLYGQIYSEKVAFVLDISGSMSVGADAEVTRMSIAVSELQRVLENQLTEGSYFNIIAFQETIVPYKNVLQRLTDAQRKKACAFLEKLKAAGETNAYGGLKYAFDDPNVDTIYFFSDGAPTVGEETIPGLIRTRVREWNRDRKVIINCIGFFPGVAKNQDQGEAREFLQGLAADNEGSYSEIF